MKFVKIFLFLNLILFFSGVNAQEVGKIRGTVFSSSNSVLDRVNISIIGTDKQSSTDNDGSFVIANISAGEYIIEASAIGFKTTRQTVQVQASETTIVNITLYDTALELNEVLVKGDGLSRRNRTGTVNTMSLGTIKELHITNPIQVLLQIPGVDIAGYSQGGVADGFMMRGFSGAGHEGQAAVEVDGVSLNEGEGHADGYADMNLLIPLNISKIDVYKGPSSALFGRFGMAGTLAFETRKTGEYQDLSLIAGSFATVDAQVALGKSFEVGGKKLQTNFAAQLYKTDGYKANSQFLKANINGRVAYKFTDRTQVSLDLKGYSGIYDNSGFIPTAQLYNRSERFKQAVNAENDGGEKNFASERVDVNHTINDNLRLLIFGYSTQQNFTRYQKMFYQPGGQSQYFYVRDLNSTGANLNGKSSIGSVGMDWVTGFEYFNEQTHLKKWSTTNRIKNSLLQDRDFELQTFSAFGQVEFNISSFFRPSLGLRYDTYNGQLLLRDPATPIATKPLNDLSHVSPKLGFRSTLFEGFDFKANVSNGFSLPDSAIRYDSDAKVDPMEIWQYEAGIEYDYKNLVKVNLTGFIVDTSKEINESAPGSGIFVNAGKTQRSGLEMAIKAQPVTNLNFTGSFSYIRSEIKSNPDQALVGKELNAIPKTIANLMADYTLKSGFGARLNFREVGKYATGLNNLFYYKGYTTTDATLFYNFEGTSSKKGQIFIELFNAFDKNYATFAFNTRGTTDQSYTPAAPRNFSIGVSYNF